MTVINTNEVTNEGQVGGVCPLSSVSAMGIFCSEPLAARQAFCQDHGNATVCSHPCYPFGHAESLAVGVVAVLNAVVGILGNILTLLAVPYARKHDRQGKFFGVITGTSTKVGSVQLRTKKGKYWVYKKRVDIGFKIICKEEPKKTVSDVG